MATKIIPVLRIFDYRKLVEFYVDWLGFTIDWEHRFDERAPVYMQVTRSEITLHLTEHHGDGCPGARVRIITSNVTAYHAELASKAYNYNRPGLEKDWKGQPSVTVMDPFGNRLIFIEEMNDAG